MIAMSAYGTATQFLLGGSRSAWVWDSRLPPKFAKNDSHRSLFPIFAPGGAATGIIGFEFLL